MDFSQIFNVAQLANALALASLLTILASGLALIFGLRDVMNFGHGALFMLGAYLGYTLSGLLNFWAALVIVPLLLALLGVAFEYAAIRPLQRRPNQFLFARLDRSHANLALLKFKLAEAERSLG